MTIALFIDYMGPPSLSGPLRDWFLDRPMDYLDQHPDVAAVEIYQPDPEPVVFFADPPAPPLIVQIDLDDADALAGVTEPETFARELGGEGPRLMGAGPIRADAFRVEQYAVDGRIEPRTAPMSFVVRYYPPVDDADAFRDFYTANHPQVLASFPGIRNVLCYLPVDWDRPDGFEATGIIIGNEVVFDTVGDLNAAMQSPVMVDLRADFEQFPSFGHNTHQATRRSRLYTR